MGQIKEYQSEIYNLKKTNYDLIKKNKNGNNKKNSLNEYYWKNNISWTQFSLSN